MTNDFSIEFVFGLEFSSGLSSFPCQHDDIGQNESGDVSLTYFFHAALCGSGMLASTLLISAGPKPVTVLLCLGLEIPAGPTGPEKSVMGADELGLRSLGAASLAAVVEAMWDRRNTTQCVIDGGVVESLRKGRLC